MSWIAEIDTHGREFPSCVHVTKTTSTMVHGATYVPIEDGKAVRDENAKLRQQLADVTESIGRIEERCAKLRELVLELYEDQCDEGDQWRYRDRMSELGVVA